MIVKNRLLWSAAAIGLILDQVTKYWIVNLFDNYEFQVLDGREIIPIWEGVFHLTYTTNPGAAWSLFSTNGEWLRWVSLLVSLVLIAVAWFGPFLDRWQQIGWGCILAGALGNGIDRFLSGEVVDFLDVYVIRFPIFNLADVFINIGVACLLIAIFRGDDAHSKKRTP